MRKFFIFLLFCSIFFGSFFSSTVVFAGTTMQLSPTTVAVKEGDVFELTAEVIPPGVKSYTVRLVLEFPPNLVSVKTWTYEPKWIPVRKSGYDVLNNDQGVFIRTAGYPGGFDSSMNLGKVTFVAKKSGVASIRISTESFVFDKNSNNISSLSGPINVKISPVSLPKPEPVVASPKIPAQAETTSPKEEIISPNFVDGEKTSTSTKQVDFVTSTADTTSTEPISPVALSSDSEKSEPVTSVAAPAQKIEPSSSRVPSQEDNLIYFLIVALVMDLVAISMGVRSKVPQPQHTYQSK